MVEEKEKFWILVCSQTLKPLFFWGGGGGGLGVLITDTLEQERKYNKQDLAIISSQ